MVQPNSLESTISVYNSPEHLGEGLMQAKTCGYSVGVLRERLYKSSPPWLVSYRKKLYWLFEQEAFNKRNLCNKRIGT